MYIFNIILILSCIVLYCAAADISLDSQTIDIAIKDRYAFITYMFDFSNTNNEESAELSYQISLQPNTFISYFFAELNGHIFEGETKEKAKALHEYNNAVELGLNAVLVSQSHEANVFIIQANIEQKGVATLNVTAEQFMLRTFGYYELSLLVTNNYDNIQTKIDNTDITIDVYDEFSAISFTDVIVPIDTKYAVNKISPNQYFIDIDVPSSGEDTQTLILFRYKTESMNDNNQLLYDDQSKTFMHIFSYEDKSVLPRRVVFIIDRSGSMGTTKWESAVSATIGAIRNLNTEIDRMNIILFDDESIMYSTSIVQVTDKRITGSINWIKKYSSSGSTNLYQAVIDGLNLIKKDIDFDNPFAYVNQIILVTDGRPTAGTTDSIGIQNGILTANEELKPALASIFCLGIGADSGNNWVSALNYPLLRSIATQNDGFDARVKQSETEIILADYYNILQSPVLSYIVLDYQTNHAINTVHKLTQRMFRGLYAGTDIVVCGKVIGQSTTDISVLLRGNRGGTAVSSTISMSASNNNNAVIERIWAYLSLKTYRRKLDTPETTLETDVFELEALALALSHRFVTPWTSMIAVDYTGDYVNSTIDGNTELDDGDVSYDLMGPNVKAYGSSGLAASNSTVWIIVVIVIVCIMLFIVGIIVYLKQRKTSVHMDSEIALQKIGNTNTETTNLNVEDDTNKVTLGLMDDDKDYNETDEDLSDDKNATQ